MSICAFAPFARRPVSISRALNLRPPFGFTGVGIMPAWRLAWPCNWLSTSPRPPLSASDLRGVARIIRSGYVDPAPPPAPSVIPSVAIGVGSLFNAAGCIIVGRFMPVRFSPWTLHISGPCAASLVRGVGKLPGIVADKPGSLADMVGADIVSTHHARFAGVADCFQFAEQPVSAASSEISAVLKSTPARAAISDQADGFKVETRPFAVDTLAFGVGAADVLARWAADDDVGEHPKVGKKSSCREVAHVFVESDMGIVLRVEDAAPFDDLAGSYGDEARAVQAKRPAARSGTEEVERAHHSQSPYSLSQNRPFSSASRCSRSINRS